MLICLENTLLQHEHEQYYVEFSIEIAKSEYKSPLRVIVLSGLIDDNCSKFSPDEEDEEVYIGR